MAPPKVGQNGHVRETRTTTPSPTAMSAAASKRASASAWSKYSRTRRRAPRRPSPQDRLRNQYATNPEHMPDRLKAVRDIRSPDYGDILLDRARRIGPNAVAWAERCFASRDFPEQAFATVQGMIRRRRPTGRASRRCAPRPSISTAFRLHQGAHQERRRARSVPTRTRRDHPRPRQYPRRSTTETMKELTMTLRQPISNACCSSASPAWPRPSRSSAISPTSSSSASTIASP